MNKERAVPPSQVIKKWEALLSLTLDTKSQTPHMLLDLSHHKHLHVFT
jgi:hypothetical protein